MIRAVLWKEAREQGLTGLVLVVLGSGVLAAAAALAEPPAQSAPATDVIRHLGAGLLATLMLAVTAGMVCGGAVFAAEREAGTMAFLEALPVGRGRLWGAKVTAGLGLAVAQVAVLLAVAAALKLVPTLDWARAVVVFSLLAFAWGAFGSTLARTTLGSVGIAIPVAVLTAVALLLPVALFGRNPISSAPRTAGGVFFLAGMFAVPVLLSAWLFTAPDRHRAADGERSPAPGVAAPSGRARIGLRALAWLAVRQSRGTALALSGFALLFGLSLTAPGSYPLLVWPALALSAGVLAGVTAFADEQTRAAARYWGEQRLPVGRAWAVKLGLHALLALWLLVLVAAPLVARAQFSPDRASVRGHSALGFAFRTPLFDELGSQGWKYLLAPSVYGFVAGHVCGLVFRKLVVACGVAGILGGVGAVAWGPSLLAGGVAWWQLLLPPAAALVTARLLLKAWASDRLFDRGPLLTLGGGAAAVLLTLAAGLGWRVLEVPDRPDGEADLAYVNGLTPFDLNTGGAAFRTAAERYTRAAAAATAALDRTVTPTAPTGRRTRVDERVDDVARRGWAAVDPEMAAWLDRAFNPAREADEEPWPAAAAAAADLPLGLFEHPLLVVTGGPRDTTAHGGVRMAIALLARGFQRQAGGDPAEFVRSLRTVVALARTMRNGSTVNSFLIGVEVERIALVALDAWAAPAWDRGARAALAALAALPAGAAVGAAADARARGLAPPPELLRRAAAVLEDADPDGPFDPAPHYLADRYVVREAMKVPGQWLTRAFAPPGAGAEAVVPEADLVTVAWAVPWERERTRRLVGLGFERGPPAPYHLISGRPGAGLLINPRAPGHVAEGELLLRSFRRAALLKLALRAYRAEHGRYPDPGRAEPLAVLVQTGNLRRVPPDPHDESRPYGYRIVAPEGETLAVRRPTGERPAMTAGERPAMTAGETTRFVPPGQAIVWSVGPDGESQGGTSLPVGTVIPATRPDDLVYLVPHDP